MNLFRVLARMALVAGGVLGLAFLLALLGPGSDRAHAAADDSPTPIDASAPDLAAVAPDASGIALETAPAPTGVAVVADDGSALWADPATLSAAAARRADGGSAVVAPMPTGGSLSDSPGVGRSTSGPNDVTVRHAAAESTISTVSTVSTAVGSLGAGGTGGGGGYSAAPSVAQLAVLTAALGLGLWLSRRLLADELSWRSAFIISIVERPG